MAQHPYTKYAISVLHQVLISQVSFPILSIISNESLPTIAGTYSGEFLGAILGFPGFAMLPMMQ